MNRLVGLLFLFIVSNATELLSQSVAKGKNGSAASKPSKLISKQDASSSERHFPDTEVPSMPERYIWKLSTKRSTLDKSSNQIPVYAFDPSTGARVPVGSAVAGDVISLEEFRISSGRNFYKYNWSGQARALPFIGRNSSFWIDGINIDYAGKK